MGKTKSTLVDPLNPITDEFLENPYPSMDRLRSEAPMFWSAKGKYWLVTGYALASEITRDLRFEKRLERWNQINPISKLLPGPAYMIKTRQHWMLNENPPEHTHLRSLVNKAFSPKMVQQMHSHIQEIADRLIDKALPNGKMELIEEYAFLLPITVIAEMLGIPAEDHAKFREWSHDITQTLEPGYSMKVLNQANHAHDQLVKYLKPLVDERRKNPKQDLISALVLAEENGDKLSEDDVLGNVVLLLVAGHETTVNLIGNGLLALLQHPQELERLKKQPELIDSAVEEALRYESPVQTVKRLVSHDMEFHGNQLKKGDLIILLLGACNRDPEFFAEPDKFDITRHDNKHISFSSGIHHCLGATLARIEGQIAISTILKRMPDIKLSEQTLKHKHPFNLRGVEEMHVTF